MRLKYTLLPPLLPLFLVACFALPSCRSAPDQAPELTQALEPVQTTEKDSDRAVRYTAALEENPLGNEAAAMRRWLITWIKDTPDYNVTVCFNPHEPEYLTVPNGVGLWAQQWFGNVAYQIRNRGKTDELSQQVAGIESALKSYSVFLANDPKAHIPYFDELLTKKRKGSLREHMAALLGKCAKNHD